MNTTITGAIRDKRLLEFFYKDDRRVVEPHAYGFDGKGHDDRLWAWQVLGRAGDPPGWRYYVTSEMLNVHAIQQSFPGARDRYSRGDQRMSIIYAEL